ncbi:MAG: RNA polymerase sigma factor [Nannocystaceae bacterium]|nr:RNA polymerase sigma factor [Nannocystaceae bacterium]
MGGDAISVAQLACAALDGDRKSEARLLSRVHPSILAFARRRLNSRADVDEFCQDACLLLVEALRTRKVEEPERFWAFALGVCRNMSRGAVRRQERRRELWEAYGPRGTACLDQYDLEAHDRRGHLEDCLARLSVRAREVIGRSFFDESSACEIAEALRISEGNVRVVRHRTLVALRECLRRPQIYEVAP